VPGLDHKIGVAVTWKRGTENVDAKVQRDSLMKKAGEDQKERPTSKRRGVVTQPQERS